MNPQLKKYFCDEKNFSDFFLEQSKLLHNYLFYKCGNAELARDISQDSFIKLWENCHKAIPGKETSFLFTIAHNLFLNDYSKKKTVLNFKSNLKTLADNESPEFLLEEKEFNEKLQYALSKLSEAQRTAYLMNRIDGKTYKEIAEILGISVKAVEKRIHLVLVSLKKEIEFFNTKR